MAELRPVVYCTKGWGVHDDRWVSGLRSLGFPVSEVSLGGHVKTREELRSAVQAKQGAEPDSAVLAGPLDSVTTALVGIPHVVGLSWGFDFMPKQPPFQHLLLNLAGIIVDSQLNLDQLLRAGIDPARVTFLPWGTDPSVFTPDGSRLQVSDVGLPSTAKIILSLRAHEPTYRVQDIITAFGQLTHQRKDIALIVGHSGSMTTELERAAEAIGITNQVAFIGTVSEAQLPALMRAASLYVSASTVDGTSVTLLQAMASELRCVVSDIPQNRGLIEHGQTGFTFRTGDTKDLTRVMNQALEHTDASLTRGAREYVTTNANWPANLVRLAHAIQNA